MTILVQNALQTVALSGMIRDAGGQDTLLEFRRVVPHPVKPPPRSEVNPHPLLNEKNEPPAPPRLSLPPPVPNLALQLEFCERLGKGEIGVVHAVTPTFLGSSTSKDLRSDDIPQLVVKIIKSPDLRGSLEAEAWFYDYLERLQGSVIPCCFGYFEADMPEGAVPTEALRDTEYRHFSAGAESQMRFSLLLLERLSCERLPLRESYTHGKCKLLRDEIHSLYYELTLAFVDHWDYRYENILKVLPGTPAREMPNTHMTSEYRLIDFERAVRHNRDPQYYFDASVKADLMGLIDNIEGGCFADRYS